MGWVALGTVYGFKILTRRGSPVQPSKLAQRVTASCREKDSVLGDHAPVALALLGHSAAGSIHWIGESASFLIR